MDTIAMVLTYLPWIIVAILAFLLVYLVLGGKIDKKQVKNLLDGIWDFIKDNEEIQGWKEKQWTKADKLVKKKVKGTPVEKLWNEWYEDDDETEKDEEEDGDEQSHERVGSKKGEEKTDEKDKEEVQSSEEEQLSKKFISDEERKKRVQEIVEKKRKELKERKEAEKSKEKTVE